MSDIKKLNILLQVSFSVDPLKLLAKSLVCATAAGSAASMARCSSKLVAPTLKVIF